MKLYQLTQKTFSDFCAPDRVNTMLVFAETEDLARSIAEASEMEHRDGEQMWDVDSAECILIDIESAEPGVLLVS